MSISHRVFGLRLAAAAGVAVFVSACGDKPAAKPADNSLAKLTEPGDPRFNATAPDSFDVDVVTTKGEMTVRVHRDWSPRGVDRFYGLVSNHYFDDVAFHRAIKGFVAQFGIHGDTVVNHAWEGKNIMDDPVKTSNKAGTLSFARAGVNSRSTQMFFNLADNQPLDTLSVGGFPPIGHVIKGIEVLTQINTEYSTGAPGPDQGQLAHQGNAYLRANFPRIDYIKTARIATTWKK